MTIDQMEREIASLRETVSAMQKKDEARGKNWRSYGFAALFTGSLYLAASVGFLIAGLFLTGRTPIWTMAQTTLLLVAVPTILLANVLTEPKGEGG